MIAKNKTVLLLTVGVVSSVIAWGVTQYLDAWLDKKRGHVETSDMQQSVIKTRARYSNKFGTISSMKNHIAKLKVGVL